MQNVIDRITAAYHNQANAGHKAIVPTDVPASYESITIEWLTAILCRNVPNARVTGFSLSEPDDGSTNRRRIFVEYNEAGTLAGCPPSVFCKGCLGLQNRLLAAATGADHSEINFYEKVRGQIDIVAPNAYWTAYDEESSSSIIMLQDLSSEVTFCSENTPVDFARSKNQLDLLARYHGRFADHRDLGGPALPFKTWIEWFSQVLPFGLEEYSNLGFLKAAPVVPERLYQRHAEIWPATVASLDLHRSGARTLLHCDVHLKNWYITADGAMGLSDWQGVCIGHWARDLCYAITSALTVEDRRRWERDLIAYYLERLKEEGAPTPAFDEAWNAYRQQLMSALAWWTITLTPSPSMPDMQPEATALTYIERLCHAIDDLDVLDSFR